MHRTQMISSGIVVQDIDHSKFTANDECIHEDTDVDDRGMVYTRRNSNHYKKINDVNMLLSQFNNPSLQDLDFIIEYVSHRERYP
jgi:hypothetical protein